MRVKLESEPAPRDLLADLGVGVAGIVVARDDNRELDHAAVNDYEAIVITCVEEAAVFGGAPASAW